MTKKQNLDKLLEYLLNEQEEEAKVHVEPLHVSVPNSSVDRALDRLFIQYEKDSIIRESFLKEQDEGLEIVDDEEDEEDVSELDALLDDDLEDVDSDEPSFEEPVDVTEPTMGKPNISLDSFAKGVARLLVNFDSVINPKAIALNRALAYIEQNYGKVERIKLQEILEQQFDIVVPNQTQPGNDFPDSFMVGAFGSATE